MAATTALALALSACGGVSAGDRETVTVTVTAPPSTASTTAMPSTAATPSNTPAPTASGSRSPATTPWPTAVAREAEAFTEGFEAMRRRLSGSAGIALMPVGGGRVLRAGVNDPEVAWSISKVPLALAALRNSRGQATQADVTISIRDSDNLAAARLWSGLGQGPTAARAMEAVLRASGDATTEVPPGRSRPPFSSFGQMQWRNADAASFAAHLPCQPDAGVVLSHMRRVSQTQQWGFWAVEGAAVKGGWGPIDSEYLVRQIAVVPVAGGGSVGASISVLAPTFEQGTRDLTEIAEWAAAFAEPMGAGC